MGSRWTEKEIDYLNKSYPNTRAKELSKTLNRSSRAISVKAWKLGIKADFGTRISIDLKRFDHLTDTEIGYIAGLMDGEGHLQTFKDHRNVVRHLITIVNTDKEMISFLQNKLGGRIHIRKRENPKYKTIYAWSLSGNVKVKQLLIKVRHALITKRDKATEILKHKTRYFDPQNHM